MFYPELDDKDEKVNIKVIGVGGGGCNALNHIMDNLGDIQSSDANIEFVAVNTDIQALSKSKAVVQVQIGKNITKGLG